MRALSFTLLTALMLPVACAGAEAGLDLPIAALECPDAADPGVPFTVTGVASDDAAFKTVSLRVGAEERAELVGEFTVEEPGIIVAELVVTDAVDNVARASCVIPVGDVGVGAGGVGGGLDLTGTFAFVAHDRPQLSGGALDPALQCAPAPSLAVVDLEQVAGEITMTMQWCLLEMPDVNVFFAGHQDGEIPESTTALLAPLGPATFPFDGVNFSPPLDVFGRALVLGAELANPASDPLPGSDFAAEVRDTDGDTHMGVPIFVNGTQLNVVIRRMITALSGIVTSADVVDGAPEGGFSANTEVQLLSGLMNMGNPSATTLPSTFKMTRVDDGADCAALVARAGELLAALPEPAAPADCTVPEQR